MADDENRPTRRSPPRMVAIRRDFSSGAFNAFLRRANLTNVEAANQLGLSPTTVQSYRKLGAPYYIGLACAAFEAGLDMPPEEAPE